MITMISTVMLKHKPNPCCTDMNNTESIFRKDCDGQWYCIPAALDNEFVSLKETIIESEVGTSEYSNLVLEFQDLFGQYLKSGQEVEL